MAAPANKELLLYDTSGNLNPDGGSLGAMNDNFGGGGGGGDISGGGGGGGNPTSPIFGCTDPRASNYDASATYNDGSCTYAPTNVYNLSLIHI